MAHIVKKSPWPVYAVGLVWLVFGLFLPLYKLIHVLAAAGLSIAAYLAGSGSGSGSGTVKVLSGQSFLTTR